LGRVKAKINAPPIALTPKHEKNKISRNNPRNLDTMVRKLTVEIFLRIPDM
jgi:hypothetical protein